MAVVSFLLICLFLSAIPHHHAHADKEVLKRKHASALQKMPGPWENATSSVTPTATSSTRSERTVLQRFMTNGTIYLHSSSKPLNVTCIRAKTTAKDETTKTFTHDVLVKRGDDEREFHLNANYMPLERTKEGRLKSFTDKQGTVVTNYTFLLTTRRCAVVVKRKNNPDGFYTNTELWVKDSLDANAAPCYRTFMDVCNCNKRPTWYYPLQCK
uniref:Putative group iv salivary lipocalin n=1 Tax=Rhipicephalus pulchellus TaxID=72859 RepID=L7MBR7_RHIPC